MLLLYINDIDTDICSSVCHLLMIIYCIELTKHLETDYQHLQCDLTSGPTTMQWQIMLNPETCATLKCTRSPTPYQAVRVYLTEQCALAWLGCKCFSGRIWKIHRVTWIYFAINGCQVTRGNIKY